MYAENFTGSSPKWLLGTVVKVTRPLSYHVELESGHTVRIHVDSLRVRHAKVQQNKSDNVDPLYLHPHHLYFNQFLLCYQLTLPRDVSQDLEGCGEIWPWTVIPQA